MKKPKVYKCRYSHCRHETKDIPADEAIKVGQAYYHEDCKKEMDLIKEIIQIFYENVNKTVVISRLRKVINSIIFEKDVSAEYLLFGLKYYIKKKSINYPEGLYYVISDEDVKKAWAKIIRKRIMESVTDEFTVNDEDMNTSHSFNMNSKQKSFSDILGG